MKNLVELSGFAYDPEQNIYYALHNAWQRNFGYCGLYDEAAPRFNQILNCEPIRFKYKRKNWLIELWKGQYGISTGGEIGVYYTKRPFCNSARALEKTVYKCVKDKDMLDMELELKKDGVTLFRQKQTHWWLSGFRMGEFSHPEELELTAAITFPDEEMRNAFLEAIEQLGYSSDNYSIEEKTVTLTYNNPYSPQPWTLTEKTITKAQEQNYKFSLDFQELSENIDCLKEKLDVVAEQNAELYRQAVNFTKYDFLKLRRSFLKKLKWRREHEL